MLSRTQFRIEVRCLGFMTKLKLASIEFNLRDSRMGKGENKVDIVYGREIGGKVEEIKILQRLYSEIPYECNFALFNGVKFF